MEQRTLLSECNQVEPMLMGWKERAIRVKDKRTKRPKSTSKRLKVNCKRSRKLLNEGKEI